MSSNVGQIRWTGHPLLSAFPAQRQLSAYVRFKIWDTRNQNFVHLPAGIDVTLVDYSILTDTPIAIVQTDAAGIANFNIANLTPQFPDMYFLVNTSQVSVPFAGHNALPMKWSTKGWRSSDGLELGYKEKFAGTTFGTSAQPIEFEIGVAAFLRVRVESTTETGKYMNLLPYMGLTLNAGGLFNPVISFEATVDDSGVAHFFSFDIAPGSDLTVVLKAEVKSPSGVFPLLPDAYADDWPGTPSTVWTYLVGKEVTALPSNDKTSLGSLSSPFEIRFPASISKETCAAFTCLKNLTELNMFIHYASPGDFDDYAGQKINLHATLLLGGLSWPVDTVNLPSSFDTYRSGQFHEFSHQLLWAFANYSKSAIAYSYFTLPGSGGGVLDHFWNRYLNSEHALLEGWATLFEFFARTDAVSVSMRPSGGKLTVAGYGSLDIVDARTLLPSVIAQIIANPVAMPANQLDKNWGEQVEGVFAAALFNLFVRYVAQPWAIPPSGKIIPATLDGDITKIEHLKWLTDQSAEAQLVRTRFQDTIVRPAQALSSFNAPSSSRPATTTDFFDAIRGLNPVDWDVIRPILQDCFVAFPQVERMSPNIVTGIASSTGTGVLVHVLGRHFVNHPTTKLFIDAEQVPVIWQNSGDMSCLAPPRPAGTIADVRLESLDGDDILEGGLKYV